MRPWVLAPTQKGKHKKLRNYQSVNMQGIAVHACNFITHKAEARTSDIQGQHGLQNKQSQKKKKNRTE
jgi:hypothetical protein